MARTKVTPARSIRISDETWAKAKAVADFNDTTVSAMVVDFLGRLRMSDEIRHAVNATARTYSPPTKPKFDIESAGTEIVRYPAAECPHRVTKTITFGTFCCQCGSKMP